MSREKLNLIEQEIERLQMDLNGAVDEEEKADFLLKIFEKVLEYSAIFKIMS